MNKSKGHKLIIGVIALIVVLIAVLVTLNVLQKTRLHVIGNSEMEAILDDDSGRGTFVYIGRPTCPVCNEFEPILEHTLKRLSQELPYYEADLARLEDAQRSSVIFNRLDGVTGVPVIVYIENGQVVDALTGIHQQEAIQEFFEANGGLSFTPVP